MFKFLSRLGGSSEREVQALELIVERINALEPELQAFSDDELRSKADELRGRLRERLGDLVIPIELRETDPVRMPAKVGAGRRRCRAPRRPAEAAARRRAEADQRGARGGPARGVRLGPRGDAAGAGQASLRRPAHGRHRAPPQCDRRDEDRRGARPSTPLAAYLNGLVGRGVHVITVNDYLAKRDATVDRRDLPSAGMSVGSIQHETAFIFDPDFRRPTSGCATSVRSPAARRTRRTSRTARTTSSGSTSSATTSSSTWPPRPALHFFAIVDEVDNILIDEARTPLIISGEAEESADRYQQFARLVPRLKAEEDYVVDEKFKQVAITEADRQDGANGSASRTCSTTTSTWPAPRAGAEGAGPVPAGPRLRRQGRRGRHRRRVHRPPDAGPALVEGLHQAVEAKEVRMLHPQQRTLACVTFQNYFRMYDKLAG